MEPARGRLEADVERALMDVGVMAYAIDRDGVTPRQRDVLRLLAKGATTDQIAMELQIARETVRNHVRAVLAALGAHSRLEAIAAARAAGLLD